MSDLPGSEVHPDDENVHELLFYLKSNILRILDNGQSRETDFGVQYFFHYSDFELPICLVEVVDNKIKVSYPIERGTIKDDELCIINDSPDEWLFTHAHMEGRSHVPFQKYLHNVRGLASMVENMDDAKAAISVIGQIWAAAPDLIYRGHCNREQAQQTNF